MRSTDDELLILVTGSQGEPRSALARIAADTHPNIALGEGDTVIFSSRMIPGNERAIMSVQDGLVRRGVRVITDDDHPVHVSGHPAREELRTLYRLVRPKYSVPTHGEWRHLSAHADLRAGCGRIADHAGGWRRAEPGAGRAGGGGQRAGRAAGAGWQPAGAAEGRRAGGAAADAVQRRRVGSVAVDEHGQRDGRAPRVSAPGLFEPDDPESARVAAEFARALSDLPAGLRRDDAALADAAQGGAAAGAGAAAAEAADGGRASAAGLSVDALVHRRSCSTSLIWWVVLFAVLPFGTRPEPEADERHRLARGAGAAADRAQAGGDDAAVAGASGRRSMLVIQQPVFVVPSVNSAD